MKVYREYPCAYSIICSSVSLFFLFLIDCYFVFWFFFGRLKLNIFIFLIFLKINISSYSSWGFNQLFCHWEFELVIFDRFLNQILFISNIKQILNLSSLLVVFRYEFNSSITDSTFNSSRFNYLIVIFETLPQVGRSNFKFSVNPCWTLKSW